MKDLEKLRQLLDKGLLAKKIFLRSIEKNIYKTSQNPKK